MKRQSLEFSSSTGDMFTKKNTGDVVMKKKKKGTFPYSAAPDLGDDLISKILARSDPRTLARTACVSRRLRHMVDDERLWEAVCTPHWDAISCGSERLRLVVLAMGGFRRLHTQHMVPLRAASTSTAAERWDKDDLQICLSLLSVGHFERMLQLPRDNADRIRGVKSENRNV